MEAKITDVRRQASLLVMPASAPSRLVAQLVRMNVEDGRNQLMVGAVARVGFGGSDLCSRDNQKADVRVGSVLQWR